MHITLWHLRVPLCKSLSFYFVSLLAHNEGFANDNQSKPLCNHR